MFGSHGAESSKSSPLGEPGWRILEILLAFSTWNVVQILDTVVRWPDLGSLAFGGHVRAILART